MTMFSDSATVNIQLKAPFTALVAGPTGSGKTYTISTLIDNASEVTDTIPKEIIYCYDIWQNKFDQMQSKGRDIPLRFHKGMPDISEMEASSKFHTWMIIDDLMAKSAKSKNDETEAIFTQLSHHTNTSVFFIVQDLFRKENKTISRNAHYLFLFKNPRDQLAITNFGKQMYTGNTKFFREVYHEATTEPHSFLLVDATQKGDDRTRLVANFANTRGLPMLVFQPKNSL